MDFRHPPVGRKRYLDPAAPQRALGLYCRGAGDQSGWVVPVVRRRLPCHAAVLVRDGSGSLTTRHGTVAVTAPALLWLFPGTEHSYGPDEGGWSARWVLFDGTATAGYRDLGVLDPDRPLRCLPSGSDAERTMLELVDRVLSDERPVVATGLLHLLVVSGGHPLTTPTEQLLSQLRARAASTEPVAGHAARLGLSVAGLRRAVREAAGVSPARFLESVRMERAQLLLAETTRPVASIAREVGYVDAGYFTRVFTRRTGVAPTTFRTQQR